MTTHILLIDDNLPDRVRCKAMLRKAAEDCVVIEAEDASSGLAQLDGGIHCVLLDQDLPDRQGLDVLAEIQSRPEAPPVIMLTGEEDAAISIEALKRGAADYLMKRRMDADALMRALRGALERASLQRQLADQQRRLALFYRLASQTDDALFIIEPRSGTVTECNHAARTWLKVETGEKDFVPANFDSREQWQAFLAQAQSEGSARFEWRVSDGQGVAAVFEILARLVEEQGAPYIVAAGRDITRRLDHERDLFEQSRRDGLTAIANRRAFDERLEQYWRSARITDKPMAVILLDIDHFKLYNDSLGHQAGDECLRKVAQALSAAGLRPDSLLARYGGEEFAVLLPGLDASNAVLVAERLRRSVADLAAPHPASTTSPHVSVSLGVAACVPRPQDQSSGLIKAADEALYRAKQAGRNRSMV